jgi:hypothetical protein
MGVASVPLWALALRREAPRRLIKEQRRSWNEDNVDEREGDGEIGEWETRGRVGGKKIRRQATCGS